MPKSREIIKPLRLADSLHSELKRVAKTTGLSESDLMRLALKRGLPIIEKVLLESASPAA